jgi:hypothetical protein
LFLGALYVAWVLFYVGLFSVRTFFFPGWLQVSQVKASEGAPKTQGKKTNRSQKDESAAAASKCRFLVLAPTFLLLGGEDSFMNARGLFFSSTNT